MAERHNQTLLDIVRSMTSQAFLSILFWGYALETAAQILNLFLTKKVAKTPYDMWTTKVPSLAHIKVWGCEAFMTSLNLKVRDVFSSTIHKSPLDIRSTNLVGMWYL